MSSLAFTTTLLASALAAAPASPRDPLDRASQSWLRQVHLLILPDEEASFRALATAAERAEFQRAFWARRDPTPGTPRNEMQEAVTRAQARADQLFTLPGSRGSETGCGQVLALLGEPTEVQGDGAGDQGRGAREQFNSLQPMSEGSRRPETWVYRSRPGEAFSFTGGELRIAFDEACRFSEAGRTLEDLRRAAEARIVGPRPDGTHATDFPIEAEQKLLLRTQVGQAYAAGLLRIRVPAATAAPSGPVSGIVEALCISAPGPASPAARRFAAAVSPDGTFLASYGLPVRPGPCHLQITVRIADGHSSVTSLDLDVPNFEAPGLKASGLILYPDEAPGPADPADPYAAFTVGSLRLRPRFGNTFSVSDSLQVVAVLYGGATDATSGKSSLRARFSVLKDGKPVAKGAEQLLETSMAVASVGPLPLAGFTPGRYVVKLEAVDAKAGTNTTEDASFEVQE
jgi:GWxTD domain-containing protein